MTAVRRLQPGRTRQLNPHRLEQVIAILGVLMVVVGVALVFPPAGLVVAGLALIASVIDLRPRRPRT